MENVIRGNDTIRGTDVTFTLEVDDERRNMIMAKNFDSSVDFNQDDVERIGTRIVAQKNGTVSLSGSATLYYMDPIVRRITKDYIDTGYWPEITAIVRNYDKDAYDRVGAQTAILHSIKFSKATIAKFDAGSNMLDEDIDFSYESFDLPEEFKPVPGSVITQ